MSAWAQEKKSQPVSRCVDDEAGAKTKENQHLKVKKGDLHKDANRNA